MVPGPPTAQGTARMRGVAPTNVHVELLSVVAQEKCVGGGADLVELEPSRSCGA